MQFHKPHIWEHAGHLIFIPGENNKILLSSVLWVHSRLRSMIKTKQKVILVPGAKYVLIQ